jgi:hypothetical protein
MFMKGPAAVKRFATKRPVPYPQHSGVNFCHQLTPDVSPAPNCGEKGPPHVLKNLV